MGVGFLAVQRALRQPGGTDKRGRRVPQTPGAPGWNHSGLAILAEARLGLAPVRSGALSGSSRDDSRHPRDARACDDFRLGKIRRGYVELRRVGTGRRALRSRAAWFFLFPPDRNE